MENSTNKGTRKAIPAAAAAVDAGSASHPPQQKERPIPNYLKPTISSSCQHCTYPKHLQQSSTTAPNTPMKNPHSLNRAASIPPRPPDQQLLRTQRSLPPPPSPAKAEKPSQKTGKAAAGLPKKANESAAAGKSGKEEKITTSDISNAGSPPSCGGGSDESDPDKKEARSENYWGSEESMAGEESAGEASSGAHQRGMIFVPLEMTKLKLMQRRDAFDQAPNAGDKVVVEENRRSKVKAIVGAFQKLEEAADVSRSVAGVEREGEERRNELGEGESGAMEAGLLSQQRNEEAKRRRDY